MPHPHQAPEFSFYVTSPDRSNPSPSNSSTSSNSRSKSANLNSGCSTSSNPHSSSSMAASWRSNASELRDITRDFTAARATSTDAKTKSYTEKEAIRFEAMARNAELMASMATTASAAKERSGAKKA
ncbi:hypothetical protein GE21DRAFT_6403 [Neurospora crassa]|uniref:Uncharacterized protein n=1 Tax=Neurospora crassa (strain ATCC 24698 / 74-OR23-1A / CBS 708.71 / DSM 1257 / FGSC 987) TaxID=367110 RepID=V5INV3_NEUCR|nr:hypothetical protein NCU07288 [Neurospora crassa OR74A]XP_011394228.1 uncharacterized protein NCU07288 [Neurospora crassa OR74A]ESA43024.1 hypothetical protein NCU07288 [Neurospora crassa OR74A]ESA43025.1 hypothetical protein, variant [Neurospora crassa OR74A]KHE88710.1 hypothetical protein GE21DRAFT_6403 [Neurospora crassa]|eukprot:XP_011394227.1 hypothetical protein NCU07288 [Neurospora crassa OR74A]